MRVDLTPEQMALIKKRLYETQAKIELIKHSALQKIADRVYHGNRHQRRKQAALERRAR